MINTISVFHSNVESAAKESGKSLKQILKEIKSYGITALDIDYAALNDDILRKLSETGLGINSIYAFFKFDENGVFEKAKAVINEAKKYGAAAMFVPQKADAEEIAELKKAQSRDEIFRQLDSIAYAVKTAEILEKLSLFGRELNVPVCVENFDSHRSMTERKYELEWLFKKAPHLCFNLDTGNSAFCGEDITELYDMFREKIVNIHCKDRAVVDGRLENTAVGLGEMPITEIRNRLIFDGYTGGFSIEVFGVADALTAITESAKNLIKIK